MADITVAPGAAEILEVSVIFLHPVGACGKAARRRNTDAHYRESTSKESIAKPQTEIHCNSHALVYRASQ
jgi:hypothetical protein